VPGPLPSPLRRSLLFFPADRPDRFAKAVASGADAVCIDLEDGVAAQAKDAARDIAFGRILPEARSRVEVILRINDPMTDVGRLDLDALCIAASPPDAVMIPKVDAAGEVSWLGGLLGPLAPGLRLIPTIETARALMAAEEIACASDLVGGLLFGGVDLSVELGCALDWEPLLYARSRVVHAAALAKVEAVDVPFMNLEDESALAREAAAARRLGFGGKAAIHPRQIPAINDAFSPSRAEIERALAVLAANEASGGAAIASEGALVDVPVVKAALLTLGRADAIKAKRRERRAESGEQRAESSEQ